MSTHHLNSIKTVKEHFGLLHVFEIHVEVELWQLSFYQTIADK